MKTDTCCPAIWTRSPAACALRWANRLGYGEGICNHFSLEVPGRPGHFLINPQGLHWSEVTPGDLVVVDAAGRKVDGRYSVEPTAFFIHGAMHRSKPSAKCVLHTHMPYATALTVLHDGRLEWASQNSLKFHGRVAYDDNYNGLALDEGTSAKTGRGFSAFFGLNDLVKATGFTNYETGLQPTDNHGFTPGG